MLLHVVDVVVAVVVAEYGASITRRCPYKDNDIVGRYEESGGEARVGTSDELRGELKRGEDTMKGKVGKGVSDRGEVKGPWREGPAGGK